jgi:GTP cyclohydrolase I
MGTKLLQFTPSEQEGETDSNLQAFEASVRSMMELMGADPTHSNLRETPARTAKMYLNELCTGYKMNEEDLLKGAIFESSFNQPITIEEISFYSLCEHHIIPFFGTCSITYVPDGRIIGFGTVAKVVEFYSRRLQLQERLTQQIAEFIMNHLTPQGVLVKISAEHLCMQMRGVNQKSSKVSSQFQIGQL